MPTACAPRWQQTLAELEATGFELLVPGHGEPLTRQDFATYRTAFDGLLACAASPATPGDCALRWARDTVPIQFGADPKLTSGLIEYYVGHRLRGDAEGKDCPA